MIKPPVFQFGNKSFAKALNLLAQFAKQTGVNPAGRPGWAWSVDGWVPPPAGLFTTSESPWDLVAGTADGSWNITVGRICKGDGTYNTELTRSNPTAEWELEAGSILAIKIASVSPTTYTIEHYSSWPITGNKYVEVSGTSFSYRLFPIWHVAATEPAAFSTQIGDGQFAVRLAPPSHLTLAYTWHTLTSGALIVTPDLVPYFGPIV